MKQLLIECLQAAGKLLLSRTEFSHEIKPDKTVVTEVDVEAERMIVQKIRETHPEHGIIGEEGGYQKGNEYTWVIDPIDGTAPFSVGIPWYGSMIAVFKGKELVLAGVNLPNEGEVFVAEKGKGATKNGEPIHVTEEENLSNVLVAFMTDPKYRKETFDEANLYANFLLATRNVASVNGPASHCYVADGRMGGVVCLSAKLWDVAPLTLIVQEAGGVVTDIDGKPPVFSFDDVDRNYPFVYSTKKLHPKILTLLDSAGSSS